MYVATVKSHEHLGVHLLFFFSMLYIEGLYELPEISRLLNCHFLA